MKVRQQGMTTLTQQNMKGTKLWALNQLHNGKKITHTSFTSEEYLKAGSIRDIEFEDGCQCSFDEFWYYRKQDVWQDGWSIYNEDN